MKLTVKNNRVCNVYNLRYLATKILNRQLIFPKNVMNETVYLFSVKMHLNHSYKFKLISTEFTSLKKEIFGS